MMSERPWATVPLLSDPTSRKFLASPAAGSLVGASSPELMATPRPGSSAACLTLILGVWFKKAWYAAPVPTVASTRSESRLRKTRRIRTFPGARANAVTVMVRSSSMIQR